MFLGKKKNFESSGRDIKKTNYWMKNEEWRMKNEEWRMKKEEWRMKNEEWRMKNEEWRMKNEEWRMKNEEWRMMNEEWRMKVLYLICSLENKLSSLFFSPSNLDIKIWRKFPKLLNLQNFANTL